MTYYSKEVERLNKKLFPHDGLTKQIIASKLYMDKHFSDDIDLNKIAGKAFISKFHFIRLFKKYYGLTPNQYLQEVRIAKSKTLLGKGKTISEVCVAVGFDSKTSFISLFKKKTGKTPSAYQNKRKRAILKNG